MSPRNPKTFLALAAAWCVTLAPLRALEPSEWRNRQAIAVDRAGPIRLVLPPATLDAARPQLEDLRVLDPAGREVPFMLERLVNFPAPTLAPPATFRVTLGDATTEVLVSKNTDHPIDAVTLTSPTASFIKPARVETSVDGREWRVQQEGVPFFRQAGAEQIRFEISDPVTNWVRITLNDARSRPVPITGALLSFPALLVPRERLPLPARITRREEFAGETVFTVDLGARHVPLAEIEFATPDPLFARNIRLAVRELRDDTAVERPLATGVIYRVAVDGLAPTSRLQVPLDLVAPAREILVHVANLDSPPLAVDEIRFQQRPVAIAFNAATPGPYLLLTSSPDVAASRYDLESLKFSWSGQAPTPPPLGGLETNPGYRRSDALATTPLLGAAIDPAPWAYRKRVRLATAGVQQLELDLDVLAHAQPGMSDLRLVRDGAQLPYLIERPSLSRPLPLALAPANDAQRPALSRWQVRLPRAGVPLTRVTLTSPTPLFQRHLRLFEQVDDGRGGRYQRELADADWSRTPGTASAALTFTLGAGPTSDTLFLETDNGDNPPLALESAQAAYPVTRLLFKTGFAASDVAASQQTRADGLTLYYGNRDAAAPRYDLALVAGQILAAEKSLATLEAEEQAHAGGWAASAVAGLRGGILFWSVLAVVVGVLLAIVARLLPKAPQ